MKNELTRPGDNMVSETAKRLYQDDVLEVSSSGLVLSTVNNYFKIMQLDEHFNGSIKYNELRGRPQKLVEGKWEDWTDFDDSKTRNYINRNYGLKSRAMYQDVFNELVDLNRFHPFRERIEQIAWDGEMHVADFLHKWMGCPSTEYSIEASRLLFAQAINRVYRPGCKAESVIVLMGAQGSGKSTIAHWLALDEEYYASLYTFEGKEAMENVRGKVVIELEELLATVVNSKREGADEKAKSFISTSVDHYREAYGRWSADYPRQCVFIGTTNRAQFLTDTTGNRRWFPVRCNSTAAYLYEHETECRHDIEQAYAEMLHYYREGDNFANPYPTPAFIQSIIAAQTDAEVDDWRIGVIEKYLEETEASSICMKKLWDECLSEHYGGRSYSNKEARTIGDILTNKLGWQRGSTRDFGKYGKQKSFTRSVDFKPCPTPNPFETEG